jgi:hypothetical protein
MIRQIFKGKTLKVRQEVHATLNGTTVPTVSSQCWWWRFRLSILWSQHRKKTIDEDEEPVEVPRKKSKIVARCGKCQMLRQVAITAGVLDETPTSSARLSAIPFPCHILLPVLDYLKFGAEPASVNANRNFIGIEKDPPIFNC